MRIERTITRENGDRIRILVCAFCDANLPMRYSVDVGIQVYSEGPNKFLFTDTPLQYVTPAEIHAVKMELWESLKPKM